MRFIIESNEKYIDELTRELKIKSKELDELEMDMQNEKAIHLNFQETYKNQKAKLYYLEDVNKNQEAKIFALSQEANKNSVIVQNIKQKLEDYETKFKNNNNKIIAGRK